MDVERTKNKRSIRNRKRRREEYPRRHWNQELAGAVRAVNKFKCEVCDHTLDKRRMSRVQDVCDDCDAKGDRGALE